MLKNTSKKYPALDPEADDFRNLISSSLTTGVTTTEKTVTQTEQSRRRCCRLHTCVMANSYCRLRLLFVLRQTDCDTECHAYCQPTRRADTDMTYSVPDVQRPSCWRRSTWQHRQSLYHASRKWHLCHSRRHCQRAWHLTHCQQHQVGWSASQQQYAINHHSPIPCTHISLIPMWYT